MLTDHSTWNLAARAPITKGWKRHNAVSFILISKGRQSTGKKESKPLVFELSTSSMTKCHAL